MDPISKLNQLIEALRLRQQTIQSARAQRTTTLAQTNRSTAKGSKSHLTKASLEELNHRISERIQMLDPEERQGSKAARIFVESVLAWEFGDDLLQSSAFSDYTKDIQSAMTRDPKLRTQFLALLGELSRQQ